jgi:hypothetical protein
VTPASELIAAAIERWHAEVAPPLAVATPLVVAIDGHGAAGKTTIAAELEVALGASSVHMDEYLLDEYVHETSGPGDPHPMARYYAWHALRVEALEPMIRMRCETGGLGEGRPLVIVEGVSSASPALADLVDRAVFVQTPETVRLERLHSRISDEEWDEDWLAAERAYFASRPPQSFDLVVSGAS